MAEISRVKQKIFAKNAVATDLGVVGSKSTGTPDYSTDVATLQSLTQFETGLRAMVSSTDAPYLQDQNSLFYIITSQLAYLFQAGVPAWEAATEYFTGKSYVNYNGRIYVALQDSTNKNPFTETDYWKDILTIENITNLQSELNSKANTTLTNLTQGLSNTICTEQATTTSSATSQRPAVIIKNYYNTNRDWYRIWSDGWCEQGGYKVTNGAYNWSAEINFLVSFADTSYSMTSAIDGAASGYGASFAGGTKTSITVYSTGWGSISGSPFYSVYWRASGYCTGQTMEKIFEQTSIGNGASIVNELYTKTFTDNAILSIQLGGAKSQGNGGELKSIIQVENGQTIKAVSINGYGGSPNIGVGIMLDNNPILFAGGGAGYFGNQQWCGGSGYEGGRFNENTSRSGYSYTGSQGSYVGNWNNPTDPSAGTASAGAMHNSSYTAFGGNGYIASSPSLSATYTNATNTGGAYIKIYQYL